MRTALRRAALAALLFGAGATAHGADVPGWLREAAGAPTAVARKGVSAEVLLSERTVTYDTSGRSTATERRVVRVLDRAGREEARAVVPYLTDTTKITDLKGWILQPGGEVRELGKKETVDVAAAANDVYNEARVRALVGGDLVETGGVFGAEWTVDDRSVFSQFDWRFQGRQPVRVSRLTLALPAGFTHEAVAFNRPEGLPKTEIAGGVRWELRDLPALLTEDEAPPLTRLSPRLAVSVFAPPSAREAGPAFRSWADVSTWFHTLSIPSADASASLTQRARDLTRDARTPFEKAAAVGRYVQGLNYVSIQTGLGRGGGYRPHAASLVLEKGYGDCKDKANLMKTLLREVGVTSDLVSVYLGDASYVRDEWPSPRQFNHAILAVRLPEEGAPSTTVAPAVARHAALGPLLFVDPTAQHTPVGELPESLQGSRGLLELKDGGALVSLPRSPSSANAVIRETTAELALNGDVSGSLREESTGTEAADLRAYVASLSREEHTKWLQGWIGRNLAGATVKDAKVDAPPAGSVTLSASFQAPRAGQESGELLLVRPVLLPYRAIPRISAGERTQPVELAPQIHRSVSRLVLPQTARVDELPPDVNVEGPFGTFRQKTTTEAGSIVVAQEVVIPGGLVATADVPALRAFLEKVRSASSAMAVIKR